MIEGLDKSLYHPIVLFLKDSEVVDLYKQKGIEVFGPINLSDFSHTKIWWYKWYHPHHLIRATFDTIKTSFFTAKYWLKKIKPDIVHLNTSSLIAWGKVAKKLKIPVIWHIREPLSKGYLGIRKKIVQYYVKKYSTFILPISKSDSDPWKGLSKLKVVYNVVTEERFNLNIELAILDSVSLDSPKILFLGGLSKEKGTLLILKIFEILLKRMPSAKLLIAGYFDFNSKPKYSIRYYLPTEKYKRQVYKILKKIKDNVLFLGPINNVPNVMALSDVIVFPATEGHFARPIIEAGFMAKPVIASNLPPLNELVINNKSGFLIDSDDLESWVKKIELVLKDKELAKSLGAFGYSYCLEKFNLNKQIKTVEDIYSKL